MSQDALRWEMDKDEYEEFLSYSNSRRELMGESFE
jgi:hypothetical protein